jgi:hypothetical protein
MGPESKTLELLWVLSRDVEAMKAWMITQSNQQHPPNVASSNSQSNQDEAFRQLMSWFPDSGSSQYPNDPLPCSDLHHLSFPDGIQRDQAYTPGPPHLYPFISLNAIAPMIPPAEQDSALTNFLLDDFIINEPNYFVQGLSRDGGGYSKD